MPSFALKVTRSGLSGLGRLSPQLAGKAAFRLFCLTPPRRPRGSKAKVAHMEGRQRLLTAEQFMLPFPGGRAMAYRFNGGAKGPRKRYLVVHGWGSSSEYMSELTAFLLPGHGRSAGRSLNVRLAISAISAATARFGALDAAIGHSFGGASLALASAGFLPGIDPIETKKLVLIGAPSGMGWLFKEFGRFMGLRSQAQTALEAEVGRVTGKALTTYDEPHGLLDPSRPVLVIHAEDDKEVSAKHARVYAAQGEHVRLFWANGFGHRRIVSAAPVFEAIDAFLSEPVDAQKTLESGDGTVLSFYRTPVRRSS